MPLIPTLGNVGAFSASASNVSASTSLFPGVPASYTVGDTFIIWTWTTSTTATVATPSGWTSVLNTVATNGRLVLFAKVSGASESAPTVAWSSLTSGTTNGTPAVARMFAVSNLNTSNIATIADVVGTSSSATTSTTTAAGGAAITTLSANDAVLVLSMRRAVMSTYTITSPQDGVTWTQIVADNTTSGAGAAHSSYFGVLGTAGAISAKTFNLTGATTAVSSGVIVALKAAPSSNKFSMIL